MCPFARQRVKYPYMEHRRFGAQDAAKGLMIIGVIFFHAYIMTFDDYTESILSFNVLVALFPFLLNVFFFYSGYNYTPNERTYKQNIARRAKQLLIPLVIALVISVVTIGAMELAFDHADLGARFRDLGNSVLYGLMSEPLALMIGFPKQGGIVFELMLSLGLLWFLYALFVCSLFFYLLVKFTNKKLSTLISVVVGLLLLSFALGQFVGPYLPYSVQCYPVALAIMLTGAYLRQSNFLEREIKTKKDVAFHTVNVLIAEGIVIGTCFLCNGLFGAMTTGSMMGGKFDPALRGFDAFICFAFGLLGTYFLHTVCRVLIRIPGFGKGLQWIGSRSALFYLFHPIFLDLTAIVIFQKQVPWGHAQAFFYVAVVTALLVGVCLLLEFIVKKIKQRKMVQPIPEGPKEEPHEQE